MPQPSPSKRPALSAKQGNITAVQRACEFGSSATWRSLTPLMFWSWLDLSHRQSYHGCSVNSKRSEHTHYLVPIDLVIGAVGRRNSFVLTRDSVKPMRLEMRPIKWPKCCHVSKQMCPSSPAITESIVYNQYTWELPCHQFINQNQQLTKITNYNELH